MNVENLKSDQNIWNLFISKYSIYSRIQIFFNIAKHLLPGSHFGHLNKYFFLQKHFVQYMRNNFVTLLP